LEDHVQHVVRTTEERLGVGDVVEQAPRAPLPRERPQAVRLARAGLAEPEDQLAAPRRAVIGTHQPLELTRDSLRIIAANVQPRRHIDRARRLTRPAWTVRPERD